MYENRNVEPMSDDKVIELLESLSQAIDLIGTLESERFASASQKAEEKAMREYVASVSYLEGFPTRLQIPINYANNHKLKDKVHHVFPTILNGIRGCVETGLNFESKSELFQKISPATREKLQKNMLTVDQGRLLVLQAIRRIQEEHWFDSLKDMQDIWDTISTTDAGELRATVGWTGGGQIIAELLKKGDEENFDPFGYLGFSPRQPKRLT